MISNVRGRNIVGSRFLFRIGLIGLVLALAFGSAGGIPLARATPDLVQTVSVSYSVFANPEEFEIRNCSNTKQEIYVGVRRTVTKVIGGKTYDMTGGTINLVDIKVKTKPSNGSISPSEATVTTMMQYTETFQTVFIYDPNKVGKDTITFSSPGPIDELLVSLVPAADATVQVKVTPCKYKVNTIFKGQYSDEAFHASELAQVKDAIIEPGNDSVLRGSADLEWNVFNHAMNDGSCVWEPYTVISPTEITAQHNAENDTLGLTFTYADVQHSVTATCADSGTGTVDTASLLSTLGPTTATVSDSGGVVRFGQAWPAEFGTFTIIVEPEEEQPAISWTGDPVAWLSEWSEIALFLPGASR